MYRTIVVGTDFSELGTEAVEAARDLANRFASAFFHVVHVSEVPAGLVTAGAAYAIPAPMTEELTRALLEDADRRLAEVLPGPLEQRAEIVRAALVGSPARELARYAERVEADLMVVVTHGRGPMARLVLGSVAKQLVRLAPCPVLVLRGGSRDLSFHKVLAPIDLSALATRVLHHAQAMVSPTGTVEVLSVFERPRTIDSIPAQLSSNVFESARAVFEREVRETVRRYFPNAPRETVQIVEGDRVERAVVDAIDERRPELVVVGTSGHGVLHRFLLGSTTELVLDHAPHAVLVVPPRPTAQIIE